MSVNVVDTDSCEIAAVSAVGDESDDDLETLETEEKMITKMRKSVLTHYGNKD